VVSNAPEYALSIKQPWASLVLRGLKTIEIRKWNTPRRGRIFIHTGRIADDREEGWSCVPKKRDSLTKKLGGLIGSVELVDVIRYTTAEEFRADVALHYNDPDWFVPPVLYGFRFREPRIEPFRSIPGNVRFFKVKS
jgi:ASCH domain